MPVTGQRQTRETSANGILMSKSTGIAVAKPQSKAKSTKVSRPGKSSNLAPGKKGPTYDELSYKIDPVKVAKANRRPRRLSPVSYIKMLEDDRRESDRKAAIMGTPRNDISAMTLMAWKDRIALELGKPYHKVVMEDFEEVHRRSIKFHPDEFVAAKVSKSEKDRITTLATGSAFRK